MRHCQSSPRWEMKSIFFPWGLFKFVMSENGDIWSSIYQPVCVPDLWTGQQKINNVTWKLVFNVQAKKCWVSTGPWKYHLFDLMHCPTPWWVENPSSSGSGPSLVGKHMFTCRRVCSQSWPIQLYRISGSRQECRRNSPHLNFLLGIWNYKWPGFGLKVKLVIRN